MPVNEDTTLTQIELSVVVPIYNECELIEGILQSWTTMLEEQKISYEFIVINDGSMDGTGRLLDRIRKDKRELRVIHQLNFGHSRAIRRGYEAARGKYVLQLDCNGRYEPEDFLHMWEERGLGKMVIAHRTHRLDSFFRRAFSNYLRRLSQFLFGTFLQDPNAPLRLFDPNRVRDFLKHLPADWEAVNLALSVYCQLGFRAGVTEVKVPFRKRLRGETRMTFSALFFLACRYTREMLNLKYRILKQLPAPTSTITLGEAGA